VTSIVGTIQEIIRAELRRVRTTDLGVVEAVYPHSGASDDGNYAADVRLKNASLLLPRVPIATTRIGSVAPPNVGDLVLLAFSGGDVNAPVIIGRLYTDQDRPPLSTPDEVVFRLPLAAADDRSVLAAVRNHQDADPARSLDVQLPPRIAVHLDDSIVKATAGHTEVTLTQPDGSGGTVTIVAGGTTITLDQDGDLSIEAAGSLTLKADGDVKISGRSVSIEAQLDASLTAGTSVSVSGKTGATLDGGLSATARGATVAINGLTSFSPA
jgi:phage baseplate assembly protein gpV